MKSYERPHIIGEGSKYDADMSLVESFVKSEHSDDYLDKLSVQTYYVSQLLNYWTNLKAKIFRGDKSFGKFRSELDMNSDEIVKIIKQRSMKRKELYGSEFENQRDQADFRKFSNSEEALQSKFPLPYGIVNLPVWNKHIYMSNKIEVPIHPTIEEEFFLQMATVYDESATKFIQDKFDKYEARFMTLLENLQNKFQDESELDIPEIQNLFAYISALACGEPNPEFVRYEQRQLFYYPLPNNIGLFGLNSFLYGYFNDVYLIGVPSDIAYYDGRKGCPAQFIDHDYFHSGRFIGNFDNKIYYNIFTKGFDVKMKEFLVLVLWINVHEINLSIARSATEKYFTYIKRQYREPYVEEFHEEFLSFSDIINDENVQHKISTTFPMVNKGVPEKYYHFTMIMLYGYIALKSLLN
jgi:hypothetical protein